MGGGGGKLWVVRGGDWPVAEAGWWWSSGALGREESEMFEREGVCGLFYGDR